MDPLIAPKKEKQDAPAVVDIRDGWKFAFTGQAVKTALLEKVAKHETEIVETLEQLAREVGDDGSAFAGILVAIHGDTPNSRARHIKDLATRVVDLQRERDRLARAAKGFNTNMYYVMGEKDMKEMGL